MGHIAEFVDYLHQISRGCKNRARREALLDLESVWGYAGLGNPMDVGRLLIFMNCDAAMLKKAFTKAQMKRAGPLYGNAIVELRERVRDYVPPELVLIRALQRRRSGVDTCK